MIRQTARHSRSQSQLPPTPTGLALLDEGLDKGMFGGEIYGIHSFTGGGATTLACMVAAEGALAEWTLAQPGKRRRRWCIVVSGQSTHEIVGYVFSYLAKLPFDLVGEAWDEIISLAPDELEAEIGEVARQEPTVQRGRCIRGYAIIRDSLTVTDAYGQAASHRRSPTGLLIGKLRGALGSLDSLAGLVLDGIDVFVESFLRECELPDRASSWAHREFLSDCRRRIARPFHCPVWITHRLRGALAESPPEAVLTHADVGQCRTLSEELDACFVLGNPDGEGHFLLRCTKSISADGPDARVVEFDPDGVREIIKAPASGVSSSVAERRWGALPVNIDDQTLQEIERLAATVQPSPPRGREQRSIVVRAEGRTPPRRKR